MKNNTTMDEFVDILIKLPFFEGQDADDFIAVLECIDSEIHDHAAGEYIYKYSQPFECLAVILKGSAVCIAKDTDGNDIFKKRYEAGECYGTEYALDLGAKLNESLVAETECKVLFIDVNRFLCPCWAHCEHHEKLMHQMARVLELYK